MTMAEKLQAHREIERANVEHRKAFIGKKWFSEITWRDLCYVWDIDPDKAIEDIRAGRPATRVRRP